MSAEDHKIHFSRVAIYKMQAGSADEIIRRTIAVQEVERGILPILQEQPGFIDYQAIHVPGREELIIGISTWRTKEQAEAVGPVVAKWVRSNVGTMVSLTNEYVGELAYSTRA